MPDTSEAVIETPPTSTAATLETEPEIVAAISSAEGEPGLPLNIRVETAWGYGRIALILAAGAAVGYGLMRWLVRR